MYAWFIGLGFVAGAVALGYLPAQLMRKRFGGLQPPDTRAVASDVMARIGVMHGLILSLVFASAHSNAQKFQDDVVAEAAAVTHVYFNAQRFGAPRLQAASLDYLHTIIAKDWPALRADGRLSDEGWVAWRAMLEASLDLAPAERRGQLLADKIQADIWRIEDLRQMRGYEAESRISMEFWLVSVVGLVLIATLLFVHQIKPLHHAIMAMYSGFTGLTLFLIYDMSNPFRGAMIADTGPFEVVLAAIQSGV